MKIRLSSNSRFCFRFANSEHYSGGYSHVPIITFLINCRCPVVKRQKAIAINALELILLGGEKFRAVPGA